eukprot:349258_1
MYPSLCELAESWITDEDEKVVSQKASKIQQIDTKHLSEIILNIFSVDLVDPNINVIQQFQQFHRNRMSKTTPIKKREFYKKWLQETLVMYPSLCELTESWIADEDEKVVSQKASKIQEIDIKYLSGIILNIFGVDLVYPNINVIQSDYLQFVTEAMESLIRSNTEKKDIETLWMDDQELKDDYIPSIMLNVEQKSFQQLAFFIKQLCNNVSDQDILHGTNFSTIILIKLAEIKKRKFQQVKAQKKLLLACATEAINKMVNDWDVRHCDEHKTYTNECDGCINTKKKFSVEIETGTGVSEYLKQNITAYIDKSSKSKLLDCVLQDALIIYQDVVDMNEIPYVSAGNLEKIVKDIKGKKVNVKAIMQDKNKLQKILKDNVKAIKDNLRAMMKDENVLQKLLQDSMKAMIKNEDLQRLSIWDFYGSLFSRSIEKFYRFQPLSFQRQLTKYKTLKPIMADIEKWTDTGEIPPLTLTSSGENKIDTEQIINVMKDIFSIDIRRSLPINEMKSQFIEFALKTIKEKLINNKTNYIENKVSMQCKQFIEKANTKMDQPSVKQFKAIWYQGLNDHHEIPVSAPIRADHVLALVVYTHCTNLCTAFRLTYRKDSSDKSKQDQIQRHSAFAHFGRLLYEAFVFYGSKISGVEKLYHGMGMELLFKTCYCTFDAPTSTTTANGVAVGFGSTGIVMELKSSDSSEYIKTLDMNLFSCFPHEEEHLIFETRLHINDIFIPKNKQWIGADLMLPLSLYDLLIHGSFIHNNALLKKKHQKKLFKILQNVKSGNISTYTNSSYVNKLISSLTEQNSKIWLNMHQIQSLTHDDLKYMFIQKYDDGFGEFISYLKEEYQVTVIPTFITNWIMNNETFVLVSRSLNEKYQKNQYTVVQGPIFKCNLSESNHVVFQPHLTEANGVLHLQMKLVSVQNKEQSHLNQVHVHFIVSCKEADDYHTSLHPRWMDTKWNNTFYITLPLFKTACNQQPTSNICYNRCCSQEEEENVSNKPLSIEVAIMIHNTEEFGGSSLLVPTSTVIAADMTATAKSYAFPDILSTFYGISNSIVSVLDSISDIFFIVFLLTFNTFQHDDMDDMDDKEELFKICNFFAVL